VDTALITRKSTIKTTAAMTKMLTLRHSCQMQEAPIMHNQTATITLAIQVCLPQYFLFILLSNLLINKKVIKHPRRRNLDQVADKLPCKKHKLVPMDNHSKTHNILDKMKMPTNKCRRMVMEMAINTIHHRTTTNFPKMLFVV
jgi:hypothetical protein